MFTKSFERLTDVMIQKGQCKEEERELVVYGLTVGIELLLNILTTIVLGVCFGMMWESLFFLCSYSFVRTFAGGYHCEKSINCYFFSTGIIIITLTLLKCTPVVYLLSSSIIMLLLAVPVILKLAPVEATHKPLDEDEYRHYRKKTITNLTLECVLIVILALFKLYNYMFLISLGIFIIALMLILQKLLPKSSMKC